MKQYVSDVYNLTCMEWNKEYCFDDISSFTMESN